MQEGAYNWSTNAQGETRRLTGGLFIRIAVTLFVTWFVTPIRLLPFGLAILRVVRVLALLGLLILMPVLVLLLVLLVLGFVHRETSFHPNRRSRAGKYCRKR